MRITPPANPQRICRYIRLDGLHVARSGKGQTTGAKKWADPNDHTRVWDADFSQGVKLWVQAADVQLSLKSLASDYALADVSLVFFDAAGLVTPATWQANHLYQPGDLIVPTDENGLKYEMVLEEEGESGAGEPEWAEVAGEFTVDGGCTWESENFHLAEEISFFSGHNLGEYAGAVGYSNQPYGYDGPAEAVCAVALKAVISGYDPTASVDVTLKAAYLVLDDLNPRGP